MRPTSRRRLVSGVLIALSVFIAVGFGVGVGAALAKTDSIPQAWDIGRPHTSLPTQILDRNGKLIAEYSGAANHQIIPLDKLPKYLIQALLTREDQNFFHEGAFSLRGTFRAAWNILVGHYFSGGSTITQQLAGLLYADRSHKTIVRKLKELWYAFQLEKRLTKDQILQMYLNTVYFGRNNYGIEAASEYYYGHPASRLTLAESVMLVIQLADPARYYWLKHPDRARVIQHVVLQEMVKKGYVTQEQADQSFTDFWDTYPYSRAASTGLSGINGSKAPYFTEYVRQRLEQDLYGNLNYLRDGLVVHTTLDLGDQQYAQKLMEKSIEKFNTVYHQNATKISSTVTKSFYPVLNLLSLSFNLPQVAQLDQAKSQTSAIGSYLTRINPSIDVLSMVFGLNRVHLASIQAHIQRRKKEQKTTVQGALIALDDHTGEIISMVGGYNYATSNFNRAVDAQVQPGSSFKPLYYSAAISSHKFTVATMLPDRPVVFFNPDGTVYRPYDYLGQWQGRVSLRWALQDSINVPSLEVLQGVGFDKAVNRAARLLGMEKKKNSNHYFPHLWPLGLGITPLAPINMARAYATFPNQGREVDPIAIKYVQDRMNGNIVLQPERDLREKQKHMGSRLQIMSPQAAYIMVDLLKSVVTAGTLWQTPFDVHGFDGMPMAGKTGTTQNWSDAWTVGFSPYYTTAVWFGFDQRGGSLGLGQTGATAAGPVWAHFMKHADTGLPVIKFTKPATGLVTVRVDCNSGKLPTKYSSCTKDEIFIAGTEPRRFDTLSEYDVSRDSNVVSKLQNSAIIQGFSGAEPTSLGSIPSDSISPDSLLTTPGQLGVSGPPGGGTGEVPLGQGAAGSAAPPKTLSGAYESSGTALGSGPSSTSSGTGGSANAGSGNTGNGTSGVSGGAGSTGRGTGSATANPGSGGVNPLLD